ncbi:hypothetical protein AAT19DRAFT_12453 [Rhodotorula toruloides]|uniref:Uncharacterized protein n=1 Tax=Rhodotorula toruloides TaxID=5286 RepID=A0A2T0AGC0_RHOTO|nr:hypothetical protein AAT19DRAFT_12453 [Rhodotorula toruloides]
MNGNRSGLFGRRELSVCCSESEHLARKESRLRSAQVLRLRAPHAVPQVFKRRDVSPAELLDLEKERVAVDTSEKRERWEERSTSPPVRRPRKRGQTPRRVPLMKARTGECELGELSTSASDVGGAYGGARRACADARSLRWLASVVRWPSLAMRCPTGLGGEESIAHGESGERGVYRQREESRGVCAVERRCCPPFCEECCSWEKKRGLRISGAAIECAELGLVGKGTRGLEGGRRAARMSSFGQLSKVGPDLLSSLSTSSSSQ